MIGLGGAEFRLPLLITVFGFLALQAVILNKAMSLVVVITALPARLIAVPFSHLTPYTYAVVNLLAGSLVGAWLGATWATRIRSALLYKIIAGLLVFIAAALAASHLAELSTLDLAPLPRAILGFFAGIAIGAVAAVMGVAGGELLIPTIVLLYAVDIKIAARAGHHADQSSTAHPVQRWRRRGARQGPDRAPKNQPTVLRPEAHRRCDGCLPARLIPKAGGRGTTMLPTAADAAQGHRRHAHSSAFAVRAAHRVDGCGHPRAARVVGARVVGVQTAADAHRAG